MKIISFSYRLGIPKTVDQPIDCRGLPNPHSRPNLKPLTGLDPAVRDFVKETSEAFDLVRLGHELACAGKVVGFGCIGGKHRSVVLAELVAESLRQDGHTVTVEHWALNNEFYLSQTAHSAKL